jgi:Uma2 family endonuclease
MNAPVLDLETTSLNDFLERGDNRAILLAGVSWEEYESLLQRYWEKTNLSLAYNNGVLEIMSKSPKHEEYSRFISKFVFIYSEEFGLFLEDRGSATFKRSAFKKGVEPDECFYVQNAETVIGLEDWDLETYPAPDVAVEIDLTTESLDKFPIYAALGVSELWIYDGSEISFYGLAGNSRRYDQIEASMIFPKVTAKVLTEFLNQSRSVGQTITLQNVRAWMREQKTN